jgi:uncharacterized protein YbjT (DUF2867 family)
MPLGVTGASGNVGGRIARLLAAKGVEQRLLLRTPAKAPDLPRIEVVQASYDDRTAVRRALSGVEVALMVSGSESANRLDEHRSFVDAAAEAGVRHLVYTSFYGASADATFTLARDHHHTERHIEQSGMSWTFLRDNLYLDFFPLMAGEDGVLRGPADGGRVAAVAQDDIAAVATTVLLDPTRHEGRTYDLTGPEALTLAEVAATMSRVLGREYAFHDETLEEAYASRASYGVPDWQVDAWVSTYTAIASGELSTVTDDVQRLIGRAPVSLADVLTDRD